VKQTNANQTQRSARKNKGINWVSVFDFLPSEGNREKSKTPTWSEEERRTEHTKNSSVSLAYQAKQHHFSYNGFLMPFFTLKYYITFKKYCYQLNNS